MRSPQLPLPTAVADVRASSAFRASRSAWTNRAVRPASHDTMAIRSAAWSFWRCRPKLCSALRRDGFDVNPGVAQQALGRPVAVGVLADVDAGCMVHPLRLPVLVGG